MRSVGLRSTYIQAAENSLRCRQLQKTSVTLHFSGIATSGDFSINSPAKHAVILASIGSASVSIGFSGRSSGDYRSSLCH